MRGYHLSITLYPPRDIVVPDQLFSDLGSFENPTPAAAASAPKRSAHSHWNKPISTRPNDYRLGPIRIDWADLHIPPNADMSHAYTMDSTQDGHKDRSGDSGTVFDPNLKL